MLFRGGKSEKKKKCFLEKNQGKNCHQGAGPLIERKREVGVQNLVLFADVINK